VPADLDPRVSDYLQLQGLTPHVQRIVPLTGDASDRRYVRVLLTGRPSIVLSVHAGPITYATSTFVRVAQLFALMPLPVPQILHHDDALGVLGLQDLGDVTLQAHLGGLPAPDRGKRYREAVGLTVRLQQRGAELASSAFPPYGVAFDHDKLMWELEFFVRHFLLAYRGALPDEAVRDAMVSVLMSPHFGYRVDRVAADRAVKGQKIQPLSDYSLASRLSYFLWSSAPDAELLARAAAGDLHEPEVLTAQAKRMLKDGRARGLATEFGGNWLDFRRFEEHNSVDRARFATFDNDLRRAMFEEPIRFFIDVARDDRSVLDFLYAKRTFVNPVLARHYGMPVPPVSDDGWARIDDADKYGRGGFLPMAVFLTKNAPGLRTSPVKRGYWVVRRLLGEHIPAPPADVPELPGDESKLGERTLRKVLAKHREHKSCAGCHDKFDAIGVTFEGFGPIGELRTKDLGGRPVETKATFPGGSEGAGIDGLKAYLRDRRQDEFVDNLCRKLLAYALGRGLLLSDEELLRAMRTDLKANGYRFGTLVERIVASQQFLNKRVE